MQLSELKGIGPKTEELFSKLRVHSVEELLMFFPRDYELFLEPVSVSELGFKNFATVRGAFTQTLYERKVKNLKITTTTFLDETGRPMKVVWFNSPYVKNQYHQGELYVLRGRVSLKRSVIQMEQPKVYAPQAYKELMNTMQPVYQLTKGLSNNAVIKAVKEALKSKAFDEIDEKDPIPFEIIKRQNLLKRSEAILNLHFPKSKEMYAKAVERMAFEEIFIFLYEMKLNENKVRLESDIKIPFDERTEKFISDLPFELTDAQRKVIDEISNDMNSGFSMNRLVEGDVGSGKTIVAIIALMNAAFKGFQGAMMAPTEVLAKQHFENISKIFKENNIDLNVALLTGSMSQLEKRVVYDALKIGRIDIVIGTHALIQEKVEFKNLGLVITDEQHRFGTKQREALASKAKEDENGKKNMPHIVVMSATPIPRTLALIVYGGMDISVIDKLPSERKRIKNAVIDDSLKDNAYKLMRREINRGHQVYIICPLIEFSEGLDAANVVDYTELLNEVFELDNFRIGMLHGQMAPQKKNEVMQNFAEGKIDILVSTTVVEVGVDVPNATIIMIEDANRFGLATLHQLRGRVGRGEAQSYCMFVNNNKSEESKKRLEVLNHSNDGFEIASKDLELRGPGELVGIRQSGALSFRLFDVYRDKDIALNAKKEVDFVFEKNIKINIEDVEQFITL